MSSESGDVRAGPARVTNLVRISWTFVGRRRGAYGVDARPSHPVRAGRGRGQKAATASSEKIVTHLATGSRGGKWLLAVASTILL